MSSFLDFRRLSNALRRRLLLLVFCSVSLEFSLSACRRIEADFRGSEGYCLEGFGVVGLLLELGVVGRDFLGVVGRLANDPERRRGNRCGETVRLSDSFLCDVVPENEKLPGCCESRGEGDIECPFPAVDDGVSLIEARTEFLNCCHSSSSSRLHPWYFDLVLLLAPLMVSPTGKMYLL